MADALSRTPTCCSIRAPARSTAAPGTSFDWPLVEAIARRRRVIVSGGLAPDNVAAARARACGRSASTCAAASRRDGVKDRAKMRAFVRAVRETDEGTSLAKT